MASIEINGRPTQAEAGETLLTVIRRAGVDIPTLCHIEGLPPSGACRLCVVEVDGTLLPSCSTPAAEGMKVWTHSDRVIEARRTILELLLADHQASCFSCPRGGSCPLESMAQELGIRSRTFASKTAAQESPLPALSRTCVDWVDSALAIERDPNQCVLCGRCVRVCEEIQGLACLDLLRVDSSAGSRMKIGPVNEGVTSDDGPSHSEAPGFAESLRLNIFARSDALTRSEQTVLADPGTSDYPFTPCVNCGQCVIACPSGALRETSHIDRVREALRDDSRHVMVQFDPALAVSLGEEFGLTPGTDVSGVLCAALRCIGAQRVFDTGFAADLAVMEEAAELVRRLRNGGDFPILSSASPAWVSYVETYAPEFIPNLSTCKSPQQMLGSLIKTYYAEKSRVVPESIFSVSLTPCLARKYEMQRQEFKWDSFYRSQVTPAYTQPLAAAAPAAEGRGEVDAVLTTRELAALLKMYGLNLAALTPEKPNPPFASRSSAAALCAASGGLTESLIRTVYYLMTGSDLAESAIEALRGTDGIKEVGFEIQGVHVGAVAVSGLMNARRILDQVKAGQKKDIHFIEVTSCPGGCVAGGGQPYGTNLARIRDRMRALYDADQHEPLLAAHRNPDLQRLYKEYFDEPCSEKATLLLHTRYHQRLTR